MTNIIWDSLSKGNQVTLSEDLLTATIPNSTNAVRATEATIEGKWYWETTFTDIVSISVGIVNKNADLNTSLWESSDARFYRSSGYIDPHRRRYGNSYDESDVISVLLDMDNGTLEFHKNGVSQGISHSDISNMGEVYPAAGSSHPSNGGVVTANFGATPFQYDIPEGYRPYSNSTPTFHKILLLSEDEKVKSIEKGGYSENLIPEMTSNTTPDGIASSSGVVGGGTAYGAFSSSGFWGNTFARNSWIKYEFPEPTIINKYIIQAYSQHTSTDRAPSSWRFEGSIDGSDYVVLDRRIDEINWSRSEEREFVFNNKTAYKHYRLYLELPANGGSHYHIRRLQMMKKTSPKVTQVDSHSKQSFINHGMSPQELAEIDFSSEFTEKHYIQNQSTPLGEGKVFEQPLDHVVKRVSIK